MPSESDRVADVLIAEAVRVLRAGGLVAIPTETVYGLAADARNPQALRRLYAVKGRPADHPVIVHIADAAMLDEWAAAVPPAARRLAAALWPGPLTLLLSRAPGVLDEVTGGRDTVGLRVPDHPLTLRLLHAFGGGLAAPSANRFGRVSPTRAEDVRADLGTDVDLILDGGPCAVGVESTIVDCSGPPGTPPRILRPGGISAERIAAILDAAPVSAEVPGLAPGTLPAHYAPSAQVVVVERADEVLATVTRHVEAGRRVGVLAATPPGDLPASVALLAAGETPEAYAAVLYERLREADRRGLEVLVVLPPPAAGIGVAVRDRLRRAAAGSAPA